MIKRFGTNRIVVGTSLALLVVVSIFLGALVKPSSKDFILQRPSTYFTDAGGTMAVYLVLERFLPSVRRLRKPFRFMTDRDEISTLIVMGPRKELGPSDLEAMESWIAAGGQLILAIDEVWPVSRQQEVFSTGTPVDGETTDESETSPEKTDFLLRHGFRFSDETEDETEDRPLPEVTHRGTLRLEGSRLIVEDTQVLLREEGRILVARKGLGNGQILLVPDSRAWSNQRLKSAPNAVWLVHQCQSWGNGNVLIDEYHHWFQEKRHLLGLTFGFLLSPWGIAFLQLILAGVLVLALQARRFGSLREPKIESRHNPLEFIEARSELFRVAHARAFAFDMIHQFFIRRLAFFGRIGVKDQFTRDQFTRDQFTRDQFTREPKSGNGNGQHSLLNRYYALYNRHKEKHHITEAEFVEAARLSGTILEEYHHERNDA